MTQAAVKTGGAWLPTVPWVRIGGIWKPIIGAFNRVAGVWTAVFENFTASASRSSVTRFGTTATLTTASTTVTPSGGNAPYIYAWARVSGSSGISATSPASAATAFTATATLGQSLDAIFQCTVTDANGHSVVVAVAVHIERIF